MKVGLLMCCSQMITSAHANYPGLMPRQLRISQPDLPTEGSKKSFGLVLAMTASQLEIAKFMSPLEVVTMTLTVAVAHNCSSVMRVMM